MSNENIYDVDAVETDVCEEVEDTSTTSSDVTETVEDTTDENYGIATQPSADVANPVVTEVATQASDTSDGQSWTSYTTADELADTDEIMALDTSAKANKRTLLSKLSDFILDKLASKVYEKLETQNKTVIGALNELNSKILNLILSNNGIYLTASDFESGSYNATGDKIANNTIIRTKTKYPVSVGDTVHIKQSQKQYVALSNYYDGTFHDIGNWTNTETVVTIDHAGELIVLVANSGSPSTMTTISPSDYVEQVSITRA